ncbi:dGTP triphosphohydrolase [Clostridium sp. 1001275B_160808_H3]|uniref:deoxyguanosinetriphosphate triphosphohydrolase family protein n=1 Tax=Clostridium sp. 1001275B_160808_H3 TaxID=2787110 RepID=UPI0018974616|nr:dNTP triphosphohydrolase [Clostridium sp. 1001275B_160808_H3]
MKENVFKAVPEYSKRLKEEKRHNIRNEFERDRDRVMYSKPFRRLSGKTQIFLAGKDDHTRTRLTHTLQVSQIGRTIARAVGVDEILVESIALAHDIGHTPFGHVGERILDKIMRGCYPIREYNLPEILKGNEGFKHNYQGVRVATNLYSYLNLTDYTLWGILNHSGLKYDKCKMKSFAKEDECKYCLYRNEKDLKCKIENEDDLNYYINMKNENGLNVLSGIEESWTFEAYVVAIADEIAQRHHDIEDAIEYNLLSREFLKRYIENLLEFNQKKESLLLKKYLEQEKVRRDREWTKDVQQVIEDFKNIDSSVEKDIFESLLSKFLVNFITTDVIYNLKYIFEDLKEKYKINEIEDFMKYKSSIGKEIRHIFKETSFYTKEMYSFDKKLKKLLRNRILNSQEAQKMDGIGDYVIRETFKALVINQQLLPDKSIVRIFKDFYLERYGELYSEKMKECEFMVDKEYNVGNMRNELNNMYYNDNKEEFNVILLRNICDYISGMTDKFIIELHRELYNITY